MRILSACLVPTLGAAAVVLSMAGCGPTSGSPQGAPPPNSPPAAPTVSASMATATSSASAAVAIPATSSPGSAPTGAPTASGAVSAPSGPGTSCATYAATHTFAEVTAAKLNPDGTLALTAHAAKMVCGGTDDLHYDIATPAETGTVTPSGTVQMLTGTVKEQTVSHTDVSSRLAQDNWGRIFMVTGPLQAIAALTEEYHP